MEGFVCVGKGSRIKEGAVIRDSIIWDGVWIEKGSVVEGCIVGDGTQVRGTHRGEALISG
jgi:NDP-sugar pyrophosphorylase family protein